ncbi:hypothetical protein [Synechococcus phage S-B68]|nr:hypothetical protein [Synechococcus phage S-B68]
MNIFYTDIDPVQAARDLPDRHIVKMPVEAVQMLVSACVRHGIQPNVITKKGTVHKGGYHNHPCTVWAGDSFENAYWTWQWGLALCEEYTKRYGKVHFAQGQLHTLCDAIMDRRLPATGFTPPAQAMPDECKSADPVTAYRNCINHKLATRPGTFVWNKGTAAPEWAHA